MFLRAAFVVLAVVVATEAGMHNRHKHGHGAAMERGNWTAPSTNNNTGQTYHKGCERAMNKLINEQLSASYAYVALATHSDRADVALTGFKTMFLKASQYKWGNALKLIEYQNMRQGDVKFFHLPKPTKTSCGLQAIKDTLKIEEALNAESISVYQLARLHNDGHLQHFMQEKILDSQPATIKELVSYITMMNKLGGAAGELHVDKLVGAMYINENVKVGKQQNSAQSSEEV